MLSWIYKKIFQSDPFQNAIKQAVKNYYEVESLKEYRLWGSKDRLFLGSGTQVNNALFNTVSGNIYVGDYTFFGHGVALYTGTHDIRLKDFERFKAVPSSGRDIVIGRGVWVASNVIVLAPCNIGDNCVIGAGSVVTGAVPKDTLYVGNRSKEIKEIYYEK